MDDHAIRAEKCRAKAEECRVVAESMTSQDCKQLLLRLANDYLCMADKIEKLGDHKVSLNFKL